MVNIIIIIASIFIFVFCLYAIGKIEEMIENDSNVYEMEKKVDEYKTE